MTRAHCILPGRPAPVATLPPWRVSKSVRFGMATNVRFWVAIDTRPLTGRSVTHLLAAVKPFRPAPGDQPSRASAAIARLARGGVGGADLRERRCSG